MSKKDYATSLTSRSPHRAHTFFLDRCLGKIVIAEKLRAAGLRVEIHGDHFPDQEWDTEQTDAEWLPEVGRRGWVILSKDQQIAKNQIEIAALLRSGAPSFILTAGTMSGEEMAYVFLTAMPSIRAFLEKFDAPFVATITAKGSVRILLTKADLIKEIN